MVYNTHITVSYKSEDDDTCETFYRKQLLQVFGMETFDITLINKEVEKLYEMVKHDNELRELCKQNAGQMLSEDLHLGFMLCFSFDSFETTHVKVCKILESLKSSSIPSVLLS